MNESHFSSRIQCWCTVIAIRKKSQSSTDKLLVLWQHPVASSLFLFQFTEWAVVEGWSMLHYFSPIVTVVEACSVCAASLLQSCPVGPSWETRVVRRGHLTWCPLSKRAGGLTTTGTEQKGYLSKATYPQRIVTLVQETSRIIAFTYSNAILILVLM